MAGAFAGGGRHGSFGDVVFGGAAEEGGGEGEEDEEWRECLEHDSILAPTVGEDGGGWSWVPGRRSAERYLSGFRDRLIELMGVSGNFRKDIFPFSGLLPVGRRKLRRGKWVSY